MLDKIEDNQEHYKKLPSVSYHSVKQKGASEYKERSIQVSAKSVDKAVEKLKELENDIGE